MDERLFARLAECLDDGPVVVASVLDTRGATPRHGGARMLVTATRSDYSIGGGEAEQRVLATARALLVEARDGADVEIDLSGRPGAAGVCGGQMRIVLRRWHTAADRARASDIAQALRAGRSVVLDPHLGGVAQPDPRLLIVGAGHCGAALHELARPLDFECWVFDPRVDCVADPRYDGAVRLSGAYGVLRDALATQRPVYAVLLNRDFPTDVECLRVLCEAPPHFLGMMGSRRRIAQVREALPQFAAALEKLHAPIGLEIAAETPHEIAVSILAQLVAVRRG